MLKKFNNQFLMVVLLGLLFCFIGCDNLTDKNENSDTIYAEKISNLTYKTNQGTITFKWTNPDSSDFSGVHIYQDSNLIKTLEKDKTEYSINTLDINTTYTFMFTAYKLDENGVEIESKNVEVITIQLGRGSSKYGFIGRGYDAINGEYFCASANGLKGQILQFGEDFAVINEAINNSDITYYAGKTFNSYRKDFAETLGITGGYAGFSGSFDTSVGFSSNYSEEISFASATSKNLKTKEYLETSQKDLAILKQNLTSDFSAAINNSSLKPEDLFKKYGTHVMLETDIGGRFVVNYTYTNTEGEDASNFKMSVKANYEGVFKTDGNSDTQFDQNSKMSQSNTKISGYTRGGSGAAFSNMDNAIESMQEWTASLDDEKKWSLIDSPSTIADENICTGIWLFADDEQRQKEIHDAYTDLLSKNADSIASIQTSKWIKDIYLFDSDVLGKKSYKEMKEILKGKLPNKEIMFAGENSAEFKELANTYSGKTLEDKQDEYIKQFDLMSGAGHNYVFLLFEYTTNKDEALRGVFGNSNSNFDNAKNINYYKEKKVEKAVQYDKSLWEMVTPISSQDVDYCGGSDERVLFKSYKQNRDGTTGTKAFPIKEIAVYNKNIIKTSAAEMISRWTLSSEGDGIDIGRGTGGDYIYFRIYYDKDDVK